MRRRGATWLLLGIALSYGAYAAVQTPAGPSDLDPALAAAAEEPAAQLAIAIELLRIRYALSEIGAADRAQEMRTAVERLRAGGLPPLDVLRRERQQAAERLLAQANARIATATWPTDRPAQAYRELSNIRLQHAREEWPRILASGGDLAGFLRPIVEVLWWTYGRTDGVRAFSELDEETDWAARTAFSNLPLPPPPTRTTQGSPVPAGAPPVAASVTYSHPQVSGAIVDHCTTWAQGCGQGGADQFCRSAGHERAASFQTYAAGRTYVLGDKRICQADYCMGFSQVVCTGGRASPDPRVATGGQPAAPAAASAPAAAHAPPPAPGGVINVVTATYGLNCKAPSNNVIAHVRQTCNGRPNCEYRVDVRVLGDPVPGCAKDYVIGWTCGAEPQARYAQAPPEAGYGAIVRLACGAR